MSNITDIPELQALNAPAGLIRIPDQIDVPVTPRIMRLIDSQPFQRLSGISQLGLVAHVYPAATHNRFEHSLGVYRNALLFLKRLSADNRFCEIVSAEQATALIVAALLHDVAHWPFCHPIEDLDLPGHEEHEGLAGDTIRNSELAELISSEFGLDPETVVALVERNKTDKASHLLCSILSGPIDVDKMDYLYRDSLHAGVPYGRNFDSARLIGSLCLNAGGDRLAITHKGRTAAELMVFARYVMFSEVYWHHAVRSATAMLQRGYYLWQQDAGASKVAEVNRMNDREMISQLMRDGGAGKTYFQSLFGQQRGLFKRLAGFSFVDNESTYKLLARRPYRQLVDVCGDFERRLSQRVGVNLTEGSILIDAPPAALEVQFDVDVFFPATGEYRSLGEVSPVVSTLARQQFDDFVKQVRVFVEPATASAIREKVNQNLVAGLLEEAAKEAGWHAPLK